MKALKGHGLVNEGAGYPPATDPRTILAQYWALTQDPAGVGVCSCGATSGPLPSDAARKRWHREHKQAVLDGRGPAATCRGCDPPQGFDSFEDAQRHSRAERHGRIEVNAEARKR